MPKANLKSAFLTGLAVFFMTGYALSSTAEVIPPSNVDPGVVDQSNFNDLNPVNKKILTPARDEKINQGKFENGNTPTVLKVQTFKLQKVHFNGNTIFKTEELEKLIVDLLGKEVTTDDLTGLTKEITNLYRNKGYLTSIAYLPPQKVENGVVEVNVLEGKIGEIKINNENRNWARASYIHSNILESNDLKEKNIFNVNNLALSMNELNQKDYLKGEVTLQRGSEPETTDIVLNVHDRIPVGLSASWDNLGRDLVGVQRAGIVANYYNLTGFGDSIYAGTSFASGSFGVSSGYSLPVGSKGTELNLGYSFSHVSLGGQLEDYDIKGNSQGFTTSLIQPLYKSNKLTVISDLEWDMRHSRTTLRGTNTLNNYELRVLRTGLSAVKNDNSGRWISRVQVSTGIPILGATDASGFGVGSSKFVKMNANLVRAQVLPYKTLGIFKVGGQFSPNALMPVEQLQLGGSSTVRGFVEGYQLGDVGYNLSLELRRPVPFLPESVNVPYWFNKTANIKLKDRIQYAAFYDQGFTQAIHQGQQEDYTNFLQSVGVGLRCQVTKLIMANMDLGIPLGKDRPGSPGDVRFHFNLSSSLF